jgi:hypothetical protein
MLPRIAAAIAAFKAPPQAALAQLATRPQVRARLALVCI